MLKSEAVHLVARPGRVRPLLETDEGEALGQASLSVLRQEHSCDTAEPLEHIPELLLFCHL